MAVKKQAAARRPAQHKKTNTASNKKPASNKKTAAGKNIPPPKSTARTPDTNPKRERFIKGIVLLGLAFITAMLFFMEGEKVWKALYESFWGLFGYLGFFKVKAESVQRYRQRHGLAARGKLGLLEHFGRV